MHGVLTLAGEGTRMLPWTRGLRKEFLPLYAGSPNGAPVLKPVAHLALETLADAGVTNVTLVVRARDREYIRNYFSIDHDFLRRHSHHPDRLEETRRLYETLEDLRIHYALQPNPRGFGDAVLRAQRQVGHHPFLLHAGDAVLLESHRGRLLRRMAELRDREDLDAVVLVRRVADPRRYGVVVAEPDAWENGLRRLKVRAMVEKPAKAPSPWAATAVYAFSPRLFDSLRSLSRAHPQRELELTEAIADSIHDGGEVAALVLTPKHGEWCSVGSPDGFLKSLRRTRSRAVHRRRAAH